MRPLRTGDLDIALKFNPVTSRFFSGVFALDEIENIHTRPCLIIVNTDPSWKRGEHWIVIFFSSQKEVEIFDSLGSKFSTFPPEIKNFIGRFAESVKYTTKRVQPPNSSLCGLYCLYYAYYRCSKNSMECIVKTVPPPDWIKSCVPVLFNIT